MSKEKIRVLLVEDNPTDALIVKKKLQRDNSFDYDITHVVSGEDGIITLEKGAFDIALLDYNLPKKSGLETLREVIKKAIKTPIVMITGQGDEAVAAQLMKEGAFDYLPKREGYEDSVPLMIRKTIAEYRSRLEREEFRKEIALKKDELEKTNKKLMELDRMKSDFVANVVHELRTPLTIIKGNIDNIFEGYAGEVQPKQKEILGDIFKVSERLTRLVNDLLDLSKIESGKMQLKKEGLDIKELAEEVLKGFEKLARDKGIGVKKEFPDSKVMISADRDKLTQVFVNLIGNAMKFTDKGGIALRLVELQDEVQVDIQDTGPGMTNKETEKIFDKFVRVLAEKKEGTGLGLPIAKDIITLHKGRIRVESSPGKGSNFIFNLPR
ncbi:MAG: hybrid sensor histidine kinase/response regulator [Candidatus Omnitrophica bacterium]|nr:hybrid sensor histidine kinase/response regulator [Candidatus Omnitrophota bacterium]MBU1852866.1 hybrid sensor histidine kinase/response regulator [Candidatus Omnitrophota bacterium]